MPHGTILWKFFESKVGTVGCSEARSYRKTSSETKKSYREVRRKKIFSKTKTIKKSSGQLVISYQPTEKEPAISQIYLLGKHLSI